MRLSKFILMASLFLFSATLAFPAESRTHPPEASGIASELVTEPHAAHHGLPLYAPKIWTIPGVNLPVTNSMFVTWIVAAGLILFAQLATRKMKEIPEGIQNFWEWLIETLYDFLEGIVGPELVRTTFWFFSTAFIFILFANWFGLLPGVGTVGWGVTDAQGSFHLTEPWLRGANADLNMTTAIAIVFFACWTFWALRANGAFGLASHIFGYKGEARGLMRLMLIFIFLAVGLLEVVSILFRPVSLSFRLYGNVFAGENILESMAHLGSANVILAGLLPVPFYFLELIVGLVQALVFTLLTAVFTLLICQHDEEHTHAKSEHH